MTITLYQNLSDPKAVNKQLLSPKDIGGIAKDPLDMVNPVIEVEGDIVATIGAYNYMYIADYARYYFITVTGDSYNMNTITGHCDVLMSAKAQLLNRTATLSRNEKYYNTYLTDTDFKAYAFKNIVTTSFPMGITGDSIILMTVG